jgi:hypothetical protein
MSLRSHKTVEIMVYLRFFPGRWILEAQILRRIGSGTLEELLPRFIPVRNHMGAVGGGCRVHWNRIRRRGA